MDSLLLFLTLDMVVVAAVVLMMVRYLSFWHPLTAYLFFHVYSFSYRCYLIYAGAPLMYFGESNREMITIDEVNRAMLWADVALLMFALGAWIAHARLMAVASRPVVRHKMNLPIVWGVGAICLPVGAVFMFVLRAQSTVLLDTKLNGFEGYAQVFAMWPIGALGLMVFVLGFRWYLVVPVAVVLGIVALQGYHRFMFVLPLLYFTALYLMTKRRRWPTWPIIIGALIVALIFPRLKYVGKAVQNGDTAEAMAYISQSFDFSGKTPDVVVGVGDGFLDQYAGALTLIDENERKFWGAPYVAILTLPVPRAWWAGKPGLADHIKEISTSRRDYASEGRIITYLGEAYLNFGHAGLFIVPCLIGYLLTAYCLYATSGPFARFARYIYLVLFMAFIQMFRDGLASLVLFTAVHNLPMLFVAVAHMLPGVARKVVDRPVSDPLSGEEEVDIRREEVRRFGAMQERRQENFRAQP